MYWGRAIAVLLGVIVLRHPLFLLLAFAAGWYFDKSFKQASRYSSQRSNQQAWQEDSPLQQAYQLLGVQITDSDATIKKAYRKLMSENHPDKLMSAGASEAMIKQATERSQAIQQAYQLIKQQRKW